MIKFVEPEMGRKPNSIRTKKYTLFCQFSNVWIHRSPIIKCHPQTKTPTTIAVKIILEQHPYKHENENNKIITLFNKNNIPWQGQNIPGIKFNSSKNIADR